MGWCLSSTEFIAAAKACKELLWLKKLLNDVGIKQEMLIQLMENKQSWIKLSQSERMNKCTKYTGVRYHLVHDLAEKGIDLVGLLPHHRYDSRHF